MRHQTRPTACSRLCRRFQAFDLTTIYVSVQLEYDTNSTTGQQTISDYTFTNSLEVALSDLTSALLASVLVAAVQAGQNNLTIDNVNFFLSPGLSYQLTVASRKQASSDAQATATQYAQNFGLKLGPVLGIADTSSSSTPVQPSPQSAGAANGALGAAPSTSMTPISIGKLFKAIL